MMHIQHTQLKSDWLFNTQSRVLLADWFLWENNEKATLKLYMPYSMKYVCQSDSYTMGRFAYTELFA